MLSKDPFCEWDIGKANRILLFIEKLPFTIFNILPCFSSLVSSLYFKVCLIAAVLKSDPHSRLFRYPAIAERTQFLFKSNRQIQKKQGNLLVSYLILTTLLLSFLLLYPSLNFKRKLYLTCKESSGIFELYEKTDNTRMTLKTVATNLTPDNYFENVKLCHQDDSNVEENKFSLFETDD